MSDSPAASIAGTVRAGRRFPGRRGLPVLLSESRATECRASIGAVVIPLRNLPRAGVRVACLSDAKSASGDSARVPPAGARREQ